MDTETPPNSMFGYRYHH